MPGGWRLWFVGLLIGAGLVGAVLHFGEFRHFAALLEQAQPLWLFAAVSLQISTYASVASGWRAVLRRAGAPQPLLPLARVAVAKLFADLALPTAGMSGNVLLVDRLVALGAPRGAAVAALLMSMLGFYGAYLLFALTALFLLWRHGQATALMAGLITAFVLVAMAIPALALWLRHRGRQPLPLWMDHIRVISRLLETVAQAPAGLLRDRRLLLQVTLYNALIFLADALTLFACLRALGQPASLATTLVASIMASVIVTLGPLPLGLGSFELVCTSMLRALGVPIEAAFAATILHRVLTSWLPLLPGLILIRGALSDAKRAQ